MLNWIFKKKTVTPQAPAKAAVSAPVPPAPPAPPSAEVLAARAAEAAAWAARVQQAAGDDAALLALSREAPGVDTKLAAVEALVGEAALKEAEREFRTHDRRVHRAAKQRLAAAVAQRTAREAAARLIDSAHALQAEAVIPANRLVALDRDWQALDAKLLEPAQHTRFTELTQGLTGLMRERAERDAAVLRWTGEARQAAAQLQTLALAVAQGVEERQRLTEATAVAAALLAARPQGHEDTALTDALTGGRFTADQVEARLALLASFDDMVAEAAAVAAAVESAAQPAAPAPEAAGEVVAEVVADVAADLSDAAPEVAEVPAAVPAPQASPPDAVVEAQPVADVAAPVAVQGDAEPAPGPSIDDAAANAPDAALTPAPEPASPQAAEAAPLHVAAPAPAEPAPVATGPLAASRWGALPPVGDVLVARALEQRFEAWRRANAPVAPKAKAADKADRPEKAEKAEKKAPRPRPAPAPVDPEAMARAEALLQQAETALAEGHLADAQRHLTVLDDIAAPAQRPRLQGLWAEHGRLKGWQQWGGGLARDELVAEAEALAVATAAPDAKVAARQQADTIDALRKRWKELDRLGGATSQPLWQRFDAALKVAYGPVAAHQARIDAERLVNLEQREALLGVLEATPPAEASGWREQVRALDTFQAAWRKLGPLEHTVPHKSREPLVARWRAAVERIEAPLEAARREAERGREGFVERAKALVAEGASGQGRDLIARVRDLQAEWQEHAKAVPLSRGAENSLWTRFKAETDAVFAQREAAFSARDNELRTNQMAREALIERLAALNADTPVSELKRELADVERQWYHAGDVPRPEVPRLEAAYRGARDTAQSYLASSAQRKWQGTVDAVLARQVLCVERETKGESEDLQARWSALPSGPAAWDRALSERWTDGPGTAQASTVDGWLLQVEMALDMPSPDAWQAARRDLKLRAMKAALESRPGATAGGVVGVDDGLALLLRQGSLEDGQRARFDAIVAVLRQRPR